MYTNKYRSLKISAVLLGVSSIACSPLFSVSCTSKDTTTHVSLNELTPNTSSGTLTTSLTLTTSAEITDLASTDITITDITNPTKTVTVNGLTYASPSYALSITGDWLNGDEVKLAITKDNYTIDNNNITTHLYTLVANYVELRANGSLEESVTTPTTTITLNTSIEVVGLLPSDITVVDVTTPERTISVSGIEHTPLSTEYVLSISGAWKNNDLVKVLINKSSYTFTNVDLTTQLHAIAIQIYDVIALDGVSATISTTKLKLSTSNQIQNLSISDITVTNTSSSERNATTIDNISVIQTGIDNSVDYELSIHGNWINHDTLQVTIVKQGYDFYSDVSCKATVFRETSVTLNNLTADGEAGAVNTSFLYLTTSTPIPGLSKNDIKLTLTTDTGATPSTGETINIVSINNDPTQYIIGVSGTWKEGYQVSIAIEKHGYEPTGNPQTTLHWVILAVLESAVANGSAGTIPTTFITLTTSVDIKDLGVSHFVLTPQDGNNVSSSVILGAVQGTSSPYTITITGGSWTEGDSFSLKISSIYGYNVTGEPVFTLHNKNVNVEQVIQINGVTGTKTTTALEVTLSSTVDNLTKDDFTVTNTTASENSITVSGIEVNGNVVKLFINGTWINGNQCQVALVKRGYAVTNELAETTLYRDTTTHYSVKSLGADGETAVTTTTYLTLVVDTTNDNTLTLTQADVVVTNTDLDELLTVTSVDLQDTASDENTYHVILNNSDQWTNGTNVSVVVAKAGCTFDVNTSTAQIWKATSAYHKLTANGEAGSSLTTSLTLLLTKTLDALVPENFTVQLDSQVEETSIQITSVSGLSTVPDGDDPTQYAQYVLTVSGVWYEGDQVTLSISKQGYEINGATSISTTLHTPVVDVVSLTPNGAVGQETTTSLELVLDKNVSLSSGDLSLEYAGVSEGRTIEITSVSSSQEVQIAEGVYRYKYTIAISGNWLNGMQAVLTVNKNKYTFNNSEQTVNLFTKVNSITGLTTADGTNGTSTTTSLTLTLANALPALAANNISITDITYPDRKVNVTGIAAAGEYKIFTININGTWNNGDTLSLGIELAGYTVTNSTDNARKTVVYKNNTSTGSVGFENGIGWSGRTAGSLICDKVVDGTNGDYAVLVSSSDDYKATDLIIPDYVEFDNGDVLPLKIIAHNAFGCDVNKQNNDNVKLYDSLKIGNKVEEIKYDAFTYNKIVELKALPVSLTSVGNNAFAYQPDLYTDVSNWKNHLISFGSYAFTNTKLVSDEEVVEFSGSVITIGQCAFSGTNIQQLKIGSSVTTIAYHAFFISSLEVVDIQDIGADNDFGKDKILQCPKLRWIKLPETFNVEKIFNLFVSTDSTDNGWMIAGVDVESRMFSGRSTAEGSTNQIALLNKVNELLNEAGKNWQWTYERIA